MQWCSWKLHSINKKTNSSIVRKKKNKRIGFNKCLCEKNIYCFYLLFNWNDIYSIESRLNKKYMVVPSKLLPVKNVFFENILFFIHLCIYVFFILKSVWKKSLCFYGNFLCKKLYGNRHVVKYFIEAQLYTSDLHGCQIEEVRDRVNEAPPRSYT